MICCGNYGDAEYGFRDRVLLATSTLSGKWVVSTPPDVPLVTVVSDKSAPSRCSRPQSFGEPYKV